MNTSGLPLPQYQSEHAACVDILAAIEDDAVIEPGERAIIPTGIHIELPEGYEFQIRGRSGLGAKHGIIPAQGMGTIDADYRGEIKLILLNTSKEPFIIHRGDRLAQGIATQYEKIQWEEVDSLSETARGDGGLGSTGRKGDKHDAR